MRIQKDIEYALISMAAIAREDRKFTARELADQYEIPYKLLTRILRQLTAAGILRSIQGARGGYVLEVPASDLTLGQIMDAVHGPEPVAVCMSGRTECERYEHCTIRSGVAKLQRLWSSVTGNITLADFLGGV